MSVSNTFCHDEKERGYHMTVGHFTLTCLCFFFRMGVQLVQQVKMVICLCRTTLELPNPKACL